MGNLRPADLLLPEVVQGFIDAAISLGEPGRLAAELTEYMDDEVWAQRTAGIDNIDDKVHAFVIPKLRDLRSHGILIVADDLKPQSVYAKEDVFSTHATELDRMLRYDDLFDVWKCDLEWCMHAFRINRDTDPETYGRLPLYAREVMTSPEHVEACCDHPGPHSCGPAGCGGALYAALSPRRSPPETCHHRANAELWCGKGHGPWWYQRERQHLRARRPFFREQGAARVLRARHLGQTLIPHRAEISNLQRHCYARPGVKSAAPAWTYALYRYRD